VVVNKSGGAGGEGFLYVKDNKGDPAQDHHHLSNLFTTPLATGIPFNWKDLTPVSMLALDEFVLWVNADAPYKTAKDYLAAVKAGSDNQFKMAGTGSKQERPDHHGRARQVHRQEIHLRTLQGRRRRRCAAGRRPREIPSVNNPIEAIAHWRAAKLRPLCVFDNQRMPYKEKVTDTMSWHDIPTCKEIGRERGLFNVARHFHARWRQARISCELLRQTCSRKYARYRSGRSSWRRARFNQSFMSGKEYADWVSEGRGDTQDIDEGCRVSRQVSATTRYQAGPGIGVGKSIRAG